ncbi:AbrB/MazE/SpoVT family DNA-binding domain-containing protein [uncultured Thiodictyon sp.]|uniref:AbrB/MazE/SpoVT family DNA-binding domain-containing protein n=1 Tax=uncultured Thiodictyon sp. TaxID=1846217 RepID=UPI0025CE4AD0|nr:AbrB/MazE/SpoVT family DNA-binding domain-containing protein [uncultured Thiodictyon sp.]
MKSTLRQIGNDRAIIIPAPLLAECEITDRIDLTVKNGCIVIRPIKPARAGWFENYRPEPDEDAWAGITETPKEQEDWEW